MTSSGVGAPVREVRVAGTRGSRLALKQTELVAAMLRRRWPEVEWQTRIFSTRGDEVSDRPLPEIGGRGLFTESIETALRAGSIDFAVHSLKDLPVDPSPGLVVAAIVGPRSALDVLVSRDGATLDALPGGAVVGTSSLRRQAQLLAHRPDLNVRAIRGNVETRIEKVLRGEYDATVLAAAGVERLGLSRHIAQVLPREVMLPAPGQGAIAVQCGESNLRVVELLAAIDEPALRRCTSAERAFLSELGGGCSAPVSAFAVVSGASGSLRMTCRVSRPDGSESVEVAGEAPDPLALAAELARKAQSGGAGRILDAARRRPLAGKRIVVPRPEEAGRELCDLLSRHGAQPLSIPAIRTVRLAATPETEGILRGLSSFDWVLFASARAVAHFLSRAEEASISKEELKPLRFGAVGAATARALEEGGLTVRFRPLEESGSGLAKELPAGEGRRILVPCAEESLPDLPRGLEERGFAVQLLPLYRTEEAAFDAQAQAELARGFDALLFTSGSSVRGFFHGLESALGPSEARRRLEAAKVVCIGPSTASAAEAAGVRVNRTARDHSDEGLLAALLDLFDGGSE